VSVTLASGDQGARHLPRAGESAAAAGTAAATAGLYGSGDRPRRDDDGRKPTTSSEGEEHGGARPRARGMGGPGAPWVGMAATRVFMGV
jgi:hypothetical protein